MALIARTPVGTTVAQSEREKNLSVLRTIRDSPDSSAKERMDAVVKLERIESGRDPEDDRLLDGGYEVQLSAMTDDDYRTFTGLVSKYKTVRR